MSNITRRSFLKLATGTVVLTVTPACSIINHHANSENPDITAQPQYGGDSWSGVPAKAKYRIDGMPKVLGKKIYARDYKARDIPGWPKDKPEQVAMLIRANTVNQPFLSLDLSMLGDVNYQVVDNAVLSNDGIKPVWYNSGPDNFPSSGIMVEQGQCAGYYGQPIAMLIFDTPLEYRKAYRLLQFNPKVVNYGDEIDRPTTGKPFEPPTYITRYDNQFSQTKDGETNPINPTSAADKAAALYRKKINQYATNNDFAEFENQCSTQLIVPMFMEPESGLGWYDKNNSALNLMLGTQAPDGDVGAVSELLGSKTIKAVNLISCYPGGGFGGRDSSPFTSMLIIASYYAKGPVKLAYDRFGEFQSGTTQLRSNIKQNLYINDQNQFEAIITDADLPSGGRNNYSQYVAELAAYCATGAYKIPKVIVNAVASPSTAMTAGSMRGFGGPQASFALETLVDQVAAKRNIDPIEFRMANLLEKGDHIGTGAPVSQMLRFDEMCQKAHAHPLWQQQSKLKAHYAKQNKSYGVGFALANQAYGTGKDGVMANVSLDQQGRILVQTNAVDMGNGSATTLALATALHLGNNADSIDMGEVTIFDALDLSTSPTQNSTGISSDNTTWQNSYYTSVYSMSSSACITAFQQFHAVTQASKVLFDTAIWPAAVKLWQLTDPNLKQYAKWHEGQLTLNGYPALAIELIAGELYRSKSIVAAMVHAVFEGKWVQASFDVNQQQYSWPIDGLNLLTAGEQNYTRYPRQSVVPPPKHAGNYGRNLFSPSATLVAVIIDNQSHQVSIDAVHTYLNAGTIHQPDLVSGQYQGGVAMGVGYALLENLPPDTGGDGSWNLNRYHVALASDLPLERITLETLAPIDNEPGRGIAEAVLCPIAPAIANAISSATGKPFTHLPITTDKIKQVLS